MQQLITGIHHVTALTSDAQKNINFYAGILGMHLVKKTVNFDAKEVYHFYYGDETGHPGSILTFFPYQGLIGGRHGKGMLNTTAFSLSTASLNYWTERLKKFGINYKEPQERFGTEVVIYFEDFDGLGLELVFTDKDERPGFVHGHIPPQHAIKGFYNVEIGLEGYERTAGLLTEQLDHVLVTERGNRFRFAVTDAPGNYVDLVCMPDRLRGLSGSGTVHHIAFATPAREAQDQARGRLVQRQLNPTPVLDRNYFTSIYFREPGGVLFEIATAGPGFQVDEPQDQLGQSLKLPPQFEKDRVSIEKALPPIAPDLSDYY
jgi:glyoxalase family protein